MTNVLFIDNFDSFTYNLVDEFAKRKCAVEVYRNTVPVSQIEKSIESAPPALIVISPGPASPRDAGNSLSIIKKYGSRIPLFGVCLGHQAIVEAYGGKVEQAPEIVHGKSCLIAHDGKSIYENLDSPLRVGRYHSLIATELPPCLEETANYKNLNMGVRHKEYFVEGVQFHPESILTADGGRIIENLLYKVEQCRGVGIRVQQES